MGYYTYFTLDILNKNELPESIEFDVAIALSRLDYFKWYNDEEKQNELEQNLRKYSNPIDFVISTESEKWYDHESDMMEIAKQFPNCKFALYGDGEDKDDFWIDYYYGDNFKHCRGYREYDPAPEWAEYT